LGTHFNVNAYDDEKDTKVTLLEGKVKVVKRETANGNNPANVNRQSAILKPGEQAVMATYSPLTIHHSPT
jgi:ferric-dicitrate binding protein FerR (iron transport regulator)